MSIIILWFCSFANLVSPYDAAPIILLLRTGLCLLLLRMRTHDYATLALRMHLEKQPYRVRQGTLRSLVSFCRASRCGCFRAYLVQIGCCVLLVLVTAYRAQCTDTHGLSVNLKCLFEDLGLLGRGYLGLTDFAAAYTETVPQVCTFRE